MMGLFRNEQWTHKVALVGARYAQLLCSLDAHTQRRARKEAQRKSRKCPSSPVPVLTLPPKWALLRRQSPPPSAFSRLPLLPTLEPGTGSSHPGNVRRQGPPRRCKLGHPIRRKSVSNFTMAGPAANKYHLFWTSVPPASLPVFFSRRRAQCSSTSRSIIRLSGRRQL